MIHDTLSILAQELNGFIKRRFGISDSKVVLSSILDDSGKVPAGNQNKLVMTLVNIEEEMPPNQEFIPKKGIGRSYPPAPLKMDLLVSAFFNDYGEALKFITLAKVYFHGKRVLTPQNTLGLNPNISKLTLEVANLNYAELRNLWATQGTHYRPSTLLRIRGIFMSESLIEEVPEITAISTSNE